jgi:hypothetical protein
MHFEIYGHQQILVFTHTHWHIAMFTFNSKIFEATGITYSVRSCRIAVLHHARGRTCILYLSALSNRQFLDNFLSVTF